MTIEQKPLLLLMCVLLMSIGQILFKLCGDSLGGSANFGISKLSILYFFLACLFYGISSLIWVYVLRNSKLVDVYPYMALPFVFVPAFSYFFLGEAIGFKNIASLIFIVVGVFIVSI